ncbi:hypothetical protein ACIBCA_15175 [Kitasatospora sp. NPDC051170]|uniref:hypothetical protein n=1 Tax=Kitasatospora sp. NPDC051170 TaxID=3364056 RepID=UPI00379F621D
MTFTVPTTAPLRIRCTTLEPFAPDTPATALRADEPIATGGRPGLGGGERLRQARLDTAIRRSGFLVL